MSKPIFLVCGCEKYKDYLIAAIQRFSRPSWTIIGVIGDPSCNHHKFDGQILTVPVSDLYESLPIKIHAAMKWIYEKYPETSGIYKTDDDIVYNDIIELETTIFKHITTPFWGIHKDYCTTTAVQAWRINEKFNDTTLRPTHQTATYCYGHGYWVGRDVLPEIINSENDYATSYLEDVCTGFVLNRAGYIPVHIPISYTEYPRGPELLAIK